MLLVVCIGLGHALPATAQTTQTITFPVPFDRPANSTPFQLQASASSGLPITYVLVSGPATLGAKGTVLLPSAPGTIKIRSVQFGNDHYLPAPAAGLLLTAPAAE